MKFGNVKLFGAALVAAVGVGTSASAADIYNSMGFESPTFSTGALPAQDGWIQLAVAPGGNSTATVHDLASTNPVQAGDQAVTLFRDGTDLGGSTQFLVPVAVNHDEIVIVEWDMYTPYSGDQDPDPGFESFGPGFTLESYVSTVAGVQRVSGVGIDAADGSFIQLTDNVGGVDFSDAGLLLDTWQAWEVTLDFTNELYFVMVDGNQLTPGGVPFLADVDYAGGDRLSDAPLTVAATDSFYFDIEGEAYVDNYRIRDVPEPAAGLLVLGAWVLTRSRRSV